MNCRVGELIEQGRYNEALAISLEQVNKLQQAHTFQSTDAIHALNELSVIYFFLGDFDKSLSRIQEALGISNKINGPEHEETLNLLTFKSILLCGQGKNAEAIKIKKNVLETKKRILGVNHPEVLELERLHSGTETAKLLSPNGSVKIINIIPSPELSLRPDVRIDFEIKVEYVLNAPRGTMMFQIQSGLNNMIPIQKVLVAIQKGQGTQILKLSTTLPEKTDSISAFVCLMPEGSTATLIVDSTNYKIAHKS